MIISPSRFYQPLAAFSPAPVSGSGAEILLTGESDGLALDFTDMSAVVKDTATPANAFSGDPYDLLTYTLPSPKITLGPSGTLRFGAMNLCEYSDDVSNVAWVKDRVTTPSAGSIIEDGTAADTHRARSSSITIVNGATYTISVEAKPNGRIWLNLGVTNIGNCTAFFNVSTGAVGAVGAAITSASIEASTDGYYKCSVSFTSTTTSVNVILGLANADNSSVYNGDSASGMLVRKTHVRRTPSDDTYLATTSAARYALPYEYDASANPLGVRIEEARTNLFLNSRSPATQSVSVSATAYTLSFYGTGTLTLSGASTAGPLVGTGASDRVTLTFTPSAGTLTLTVSGTMDYVQLEAGSFATSPIVTAGSTVTRAADNIRLSTGAFPYSATASTLYLYTSIVSGSQVAATLSNGTANQFIYVNSVAGQQFSTYNAGSSVDLDAGTPSGLVKTAGAAQASDGAVVLNGGAPATSGSVVMPTGITNLYLGSFNSSSAHLNGYIRQFAYFPTRKSNAELQALTS